MARRLPTDREKAVLRAAVRWWKSHRPIGWSLAEHLEFPSVNAGYSKSAGSLSRVVARMVEPVSKKRGKR